MLVTDGDNVGVLAAVRGLARAGYRPWVAAVNRRSPVLRSRAAEGCMLVPSPSDCAESFAARVAEAARALGLAAVVPGAEAGMLALAGRERQFGPDCRLAVCDRDTAVRATDKGVLNELAAEAEIEVPPTFVISAEEARQSLPVPLPAVVKPLRSQVKAGGGFRAINVRVVTSRDGAVQALRALPEERGIVQHYHDGGLIGVAGVFWDGGLVTAVHQRAVRTWPVGCGEMSFAVAQPRDGALEERVQRLLTVLGWSGLFQMQFLDTAEGRLLIDLNPRVYGSLALALGIGQNLPAIWIDLLLGREPVRGDYREDVCFRNELLDTFSRLSSRKPPMSHRGVPEGELPRRVVNAFFDSRDPMPLVGVAPILVAKLLARSRRPAQFKTAR